MLPEMGFRAIRKGGRSSFVASAQKSVEQPLTAHKGHQQAFDVLALASQLTGAIVELGLSMSFFCPGVQDKAIFRFKL